MVFAVYIILLMFDCTFFMTLQSVSLGVKLMLLLLESQEALQVFSQNKPALILASSHLRY